MNLWHRFSSGKGKTTSRGPIIVFWQSVVFKSRRNLALFETNLLVNRCVCQLVCCHGKWVSVTQSFLQLRARKFRLLAGFEISPPEQFITVQPLKQDWGLKPRSASTGVLVCETGLRVQPNSASTGVLSCPDHVHKSPVSTSVWKLDVKFRFSWVPQLDLNLHPTLDSLSCTVANF